MQTADDSPSPLPSEFTDRTNKSNSFEPGAGPAIYQAWSLKQGVKLATSHRRHYL